MLVRQRTIARIAYIHHRARWLAWNTRLGSLGDGTVIRSTVKIYSPRQVQIGRQVSLNDFVHIWGAAGVTIGDNCMIAAHVVITSQSHDVDALQRGLLYRDTNANLPVNILANVWIGSGACILPGVTIGEGSVVGAGAVVTRDVPAACLVVGVPARVARRLQIGACDI